MQKTVAAENPDAYVKAVGGWQRPCVEKLRAAVRSAAALNDELGDPTRIVRKAAKAR